MDEAKRKERARRIRSAVVLMEQARRKFRQYIKRLEERRQEAADEERREDSTRGTLGTT